MICLGSLGRTFWRWLERKSPRQVGRMGVPGMRLSLFPWLGFQDSPISFNTVETSAVRPQGLLDAYTATVPEVDGDSTPFRAASLCVLPII